MTPELTRQLFDYNHWANHRALEAAAQLSDEQFTKPLGSSFSSVRDSFPDDSHIQTVPELREHWRPQGQRLLAFVNGLTPADLDRVLEYKTLKFGVYRNPLWQSLQHLANHGTYHRGQVATLLRQLGATPILTDLMHFYRERSVAASA